MKVAADLKRTLKFSFSFLFTAGITYWISRSWLRTRGDFGEEPHWLEKISGPTHMVSAFFFLFVFGIVWIQHIRPAIRTNRQRFTGWLFAGMVTTMALSGVALIYVGNDAVLALLGKLHPIIGTSMLPILVFHWNRKKKTRYAG
jgi:hypothetical protein